MIFYGIKRLTLINSAKTSLCELPLDAPLALTGRNNIGKSSIISSLQFLFLSDMTDMLFPGYTPESTKRHYFPTAESFVLAELATENGTFVIGAGGLGPVGGYDYQLFAYQGSIERSDYVAGEGEEIRCANLKAVEKNLQQRKIQLRLLKRHEMRQALTGQNIRVGGEPFTIGMIRLKRETDDHYALFVRIFKNLLHMRDIAAAELKRLFIDIFQPSATTDFVGTYHQVMRPVGERKQDLDIRLSIAGDIDELVELDKQYQRNLLVLNLLWGAIQIKYTALDQGHNAVLQRLEEQRAKVLAEWDAKKASRKPLQDRLVEVGQSLAPVEKAIENLREAEARFALIQSRSNIERQVEHASRDYNEKRDALARLGARDLMTVERELKEARANLSRAEGLLHAIGNNLFHWLASRFEEEEIITLTKLLSNDLLGREIGKGISIYDPEGLEKAARSLLNKVHDGVYDDGRVRVELQSVGHVDVSSYLNEETLRANYQHYAQQVDRLKHDGETARQRASIQEQCDAAEEYLRETKDYLAAYDAYLEEKAKEPKYKNELVRLARQREDIQASLARLDVDIDGLHGQAEQLKGSIAEQTNRYESISDLNRKIRPAEAQSTSHETMEVPDDLLVMMETYVAAYDEIYGRGASEGRPALGTGLKRDIERLFETIEAKGGAQFARGDTQEEQIRALQEAVSAIEESRLAWQRAEETAIVELGQGLKILRNAVEMFKNQVQKFSSRIGSRPVSNLKRVEFDVQFTDLYTAVKDIVENNEIWGDAHKARAAFDNLARRVGKDVKLGSDALFTIGIKVTQVSDGKEETRSYPSLKVESEGTGVTVKMLVNMLLLSELRSPRKGQQVRIPIYLDEASRLEERNQRNIIEMAAQLGFVPIFASVEPQDTTTYWVGLEYESDAESRIAVVTEDDWWRLEPRPSAAVADAR